MNLQVGALKILCLQLTAKRQWSLATVALACRQLAAQLPNSCEQKADEPNPPLLSVLAQAIELLPRLGNLLELPGHQIQKVNAA